MNTTRLQLFATLHPRMTEAEPLQRHLRHAYLQVEAVTEELQREKSEGKEASKQAADAAAAAASHIQRLEADVQSKDAEIKSNLQNIERCSLGVCEAAVTITAS